MSSPASCDVCEDPAVKFCKQCEAPFCENCAPVVHSDDLAVHELIDLDKKGEKSKKDKKTKKSKKGKKGKGEKPSNPLPVVATENLSKNERIRNSVIQEIISTEQVNDLECIIDVFIIPFRKLNMKPEDEILIFSNCQTLLGCNSKLLMDLKKSNGTASDLIQVFTDFVPFLKMYNVYCTNRSKSEARLEELSKVTKFSEFVKSCQSEPRTRGLNLNAFLVKPIQRICKYPLFFRELSKTFDENDDPQQKEKLLHLLEEVEKVSLYVNEKSKEQEALDKIVEIQNMISSEKLELVEHNRKFIKEGVFDVEHNGAEDKVKLFLFSDLLLIVKEAQGLFKKGYELRAKLFLYQVRITQIADQCAFELLGESSEKEKPWIIKCSSPTENTEWIKDLRTLKKLLMKLNIERKSLLSPQPVVAQAQKAVCKVYFVLDEKMGPQHVTLLVTQNDLASDLRRQAWAKIKKQQGLSDDHILETYTLHLVLKKGKDKAIKAEENIFDIVTSSEKKSEKFGSSIDSCLKLAPDRRSTLRASKKQPSMSISGPTNFQSVTHVSREWEWSGEDPEKMFDLQRKLGEGAYGSVYKAVHTKIPEFVVAIKKVPVGDKPQEVESELNILKACKCPQIVSYFGSVTKADKIWILMEFASCGSLEGLLKVANKANKVLTETCVASVCLQVTKGLIYLHSTTQKKLPIIHRDLKPGNILLTENGEAKLADFGVSAQLDKTLGVAKTTIGTPIYLAPETIDDQYNVKVDVWALGIVAIECLQGKPPYGSANVMRMLHMIATGPAPTLEEPSKFSEDAVQFVAKCLTRDPVSRPQSIELIPLPFLIGVTGEEQLHIIKALSEFLEQGISDKNIERVRSLPDRVSPLPSPSPSPSTSLEKPLDKQSPKPPLEKLHLEPSAKPKEADNSPNTSQKMEESPKNSQKVDESPKTTQKMEESPKNSQKINESPKTTQKMNESPKNSQKVDELPKPTQQIEKEGKENPSLTISTQVKPSLQSRMAAFTATQPQEPASPPPSKTGRISMKIESKECAVCSKKVYPLDAITLESVSFHKSCFRCAKCKAVLRNGFYKKKESQYFCDFCAK